MQSIIHRISTILIGQGISTSGHGAWEEHLHIKKIFRWQTQRILQGKRLLHGAGFYEGVLNSEWVLIHGVKFTGWGNCTRQGTLT